MIALCKMEAYKLWKRPSFLIAIGFLWLCNLGFFFYTQSRNASISPSAYRNLQSVLSTMDNEDCYAYVREYQEQLNAFVIIQTLDELQQRGELQEEMKVSLLQQQPNALDYRDAYEQGNLLFTDQLETEQALLKEVVQEFDLLHDYPEKLIAIQEKATQLSTISIFQKASSFSISNIQKTAKDYQSMQTIQPIYESEKGIVTAISFPLTSIILFLLTMAIASFLILEEKERQLYSMVRFSVHGTWKTMIAKLLVMDGSMGGLTILFLLSNLILSSSLFSLGDLQRPIQSLASYQGVIYPITVLQFLFVFFLLKWLVMTWIGSMMYLISLLSKYRMASILSVVSLVLISYGCYLFIDPNHTLRIFHYLNVISLIQCEVMIRTYVNFNFMGTPVALFHVCLLSLVVLSILFHFLSLLCFAKKRNFLLSSLSFSFPTILLQHFPSMMFQEAYKLIWLEKAGILLLLPIILLWQTSTTQPYLTQTQRFIMQYMETLEGPLTKDKEDFLFKEQRRFEQIEEDIEGANQAYLNGVYTKQQTNTIIQQLELQASNQEAFTSIMEQYEYVALDSSRAFLFTDGYEQLFLQPQESLFPAMICMLICLFALSDSFSFEYRNQCQVLISTTLHGRIKLIHRKFHLACGCMSLCFLFTFGLSLYQCATSYGLPALSSSITSLTNYATLPSSLSIGAFLFLCFAAQWFACFLFLIMMLALSVVVKKQVTTILVGALCFLLPLCLSYAGVTSFEGITLVPLLTLSHYLASQSYTTLLFSGLCYVALASLSYVVFRRAYRHR